MREMRLKHRLYILLAILAGCIGSFPAYGEEYHIGFDVQTAGETIDSVFAENLTKGTVEQLAGNETLELTKVSSGLEQMVKARTEELLVYPNPVFDGNCKLHLSLQIAGDALISIHDISGKTLLNGRLRLNNGHNEFSLKNLGTGVLLVRLVSGRQVYSTRIVSFSPSQGTVRVENSLPDFTHETGIAGADRQSFSGTRVAHDEHTKTLAFSEGDIIRLTAKSGNKRTVRVIEPKKDEIILFEFHECADADGNLYPVAIIGDQAWMTENLRTTRYNDGSAITNGLTNDAWNDTTQGLYCWYDNDISHKFPYGALYNWKAVAGKKLAPAGWHVPTKEDWLVLFDQLENLGHLALKEPGNTHWIFNEPEVTNSTGFSALPGGMRNTDTEEIFTRLGLSGYWWTSTYNNDPPPMIAAGMTKDTRNSRWSPPPSAHSVYIEYYYYTTPTSLNNGLSVRCVKNTPPRVRTGKVFLSKADAAKCEIEVYNDGGEAVTEQGICWSSQNTEPTIADSHSTTNITMSPSVAGLTGLTVNTTYHARAYAVNTQGIGYGETMSFTTYEPEILSDIDGNAYNTLKIGNQIWMTEDLRVSRLNDGSAIARIDDNTIWAGTSLAAYCMYNNTIPEEGYGYLYNQYAITNSKLAPAGWHIPTEEEWAELTDYLRNNSRENIGGSRMKEAGTTHWLAPNEGANNLSGFTALPGGIRLTDGLYSEKGERGTWWSCSTSPYYQEPHYYTLVLSYEYTGNMGSYSYGNYGYSVRCLRDYPARVTTLLKEVGQTSAGFGIELFKGGGHLIRKGICWSTSTTTPSVGNANVIDFAPDYTTAWQNVTDLQPGTTYHVRAFAQNSTGISYGETITFSTQNSETVQDIDGNVYHTIKIGTQTWMVENLRTTHYNDGTQIPQIWGYFYAEPGYSLYANNSENKNTYGLLYNWYAVGTGKLAPTGWRVPSENDWLTLINYLGGTEVAGGKLKETGTAHWLSPNGDASDYGFTALPGGRREGESAYFLHMKSAGYWWSSKPTWEDDFALSIELNYYDGSVYVNDHGYKSAAMSVRCIKDE